MSSLHPPPPPPPPSLLGLLGAFTALDGQDARPQTETQRAERPSLGHRVAWGAEEQEQGGPIQAGWGGRPSGGQGFRGEARSTGGLAGRGNWPKTCRWLPSGLVGMRGQDLAGVQGAVGLGRKAMGEQGLILRCQATSGAGT